MGIYFYLSDIVYLISCLICLIMIIRSYRAPAHARIWHKIFAQESAIVSGIILCFFIIISVLDSIHIHSLNLPSLLDQILAPLNHSMEYSYSAPFSAVSFIPTIYRENDSYQQVYTHLKYIPQIFSSNEYVHDWVVKTALKISFFYWGVFLILRLILKTYLLKLSRVKKIAFYTCLIICWLTVLTYILSRSVHVCGTGQIGQDILYQAIKSIRTGLFISFMTTLIIFPFSLVLGLIAGYFGGKCDAIIQFIYTVVHSIPSVLLIGASLLSWQVLQEHYFSNWTMMKQADVKLVIICILLGLTNWASLCRYIRVEVLKLRELNYIKAAKLLGSSSYKILYRHLMPNVMHMVIITLVLDFSYFILAESVFTYIGIGVSPITISWGNMINAARLELAREPIVWWPLVTAFGFMFSVVLVCNLFADALRKALNPREELFYQKA
jgi:peptide/nickel transport system permease protein